MRLLEKEFYIERFNTTIKDVDHLMSIKMSDQLFMHIKFGYRMIKDKPQTMAVVKNKYTND